jgi:hypothetical protein
MLTLKHPSDFDKTIKDDEGVTAYAISDDGCIEVWGADRDCTLYCRFDSFDTACRWAKVLRRLTNQQG